jgi:peptide subunit release factor RF-3
LQPDRVRKIVPVIFGSSTKAIGIKNLINIIKKYSPAPRPERV